LALQSWMDTALVDFLIVLFRRVISVQYVMIT